MPVHEARLGGHWSLAVICSPKLVTLPLGREQPPALEGDDIQSGPPPPGAQEVD